MLACTYETKVFVKKKNEVRTHKSNIHRQKISKQRERERERERERVRVKEHYTSKATSNFSFLFVLFSNTAQK